MNKAKREALESAGWAFGDYGDFLGLTDAERRLVEFRAGSPGASARPACGGG